MGDSVPMGLYIYIVSIFWGPPVRSPKGFYLLLGLFKLSSSMDSAHSLSFSSDGHKWQLNEDPPQHLGQVQIFTPVLIWLVLDSHRAQIMGNPSRALSVTSSGLWIPSSPDSYLSGSWGERTQVEFGNGRTAGCFSQHISRIPFCL